MDDLFTAFWKHLEFRIAEYMYSSLRDFCILNNLNYQIIAGARRRRNFPRLEDIIRFSEYLDVDINTLIYGDRFVNILDNKEIRMGLQKIGKTKIIGIFDALLKADDKHLEAVEMVLGIYKG